MNCVANFENQEKVLQDTEDLISHYESMISVETEDEDAMNMNSSAATQRVETPEEDGAAMSSDFQL